MKFYINGGDERAKDMEAMHTTLHKLPPLGNISLIILCCITFKVGLYSFSMLISYSCRNITKVLGSHVFKSPATLLWWKFNVQRGFLWYSINIWGLEEEEEKKEKILMLCICITAYWWWSRIFWSAYWRKRICASCAHISLSLDFNIFGCCIREIICSRKYIYHI